MTSAGGRGYMRAGFVQALSLRLLTASLAIVIPLFGIDALGQGPAGAGTLVVILWIGNAVGVVASVSVVRDQSASSVGGFLVLAAAMAALAYGVGWGASPLTLLAGVGMGLPQPFLSGLMHQDSPPGRPFSGLGIYSTALGTGLVLGPLMSYGVFHIGGFTAVFLSLSAVCVLGAAAAGGGVRRLSALPRPPAPSPSSWSRALARVAFRRAFLVNFLYSLLLPLFLSYGAIYAEGRFGFTTTEAFLLFTGVFAISVAARGVAVRMVRRLHILFTASAALLLVSCLCLGFAPVWWVFVLGMFLFSLPHAFVYPLASYYAFTSVEEADVMNASYAFQASSGAAELLSPAAAVALVGAVGVQSLFVGGAVLAALALGAAAYAPPWNRDPRPLPSV